MRVVKFDEFIRMPAGTVFAVYEPYVMKSEVQIKTDTGHPSEYPSGWSDWIFSGTADFFPKVNGEYSYPLEPYPSESVPTEYMEYDTNPTAFNRDDLFLIYEINDLVKVAIALNEILRVQQAHRYDEFAKRIEKLLTNNKEN